MTGIRQRPAADASGEQRRPTKDGLVHIYKPDFTRRGGAPNGYFARRAAGYWVVPVTHALRINLPHCADSYPDSGPTVTRASTPYHVLVRSIHG